MKHVLETQDLQEIQGLLGDAVQRFAGKTVLITGAAGFLGRYFSEFFALLNETALDPPCRVILLDNMITAWRDLAGLDDRDGLTFVRHDVTSPYACEEGIDYIIHAAGIASPHYYRKYPLETIEAATIGTRNMLQLALEKNVEAVLYFSSSEIYGDPDPLHVPIQESYRGNVSCTGPRACYDESKRLGETFCSVYHDHFGVKTKVVRPFNVYGPGMKQYDYRVLPQIASHIIRSEPMSIYGTGRQTRTFSYITDAINGFIRTLLDGLPGDAYNIGNSEPEISMIGLLQVIGEVTGKKVDYFLTEYPDTYPGDEPMRRCPDVSKAAFDLGYRPTVALPVGLKRYFDWAMANYTDQEE